MATSVYRDLTGCVFDRWTVVNRAPNSPARRTCWNCMCACGTSRVVLGCSLITGKSRSCGCLKNEVSRACHTTHGLRYRPEYVAWMNMRMRCENPLSIQYKHYGGRGIAVCDRWRTSFENFFADMGPRPSPHHTLERLCVDGDYELSNCTWIEGNLQQSNTRANRWITFDGRTQTLTQWARELGIGPSGLARRIDVARLPLDIALTIPPGQMKKHYR